MYNLYWYCQMIIGGFMCLCGLGLLIVSVVNIVTHIWFYKKCNANNEVDNVNWDELNYLSNSAIDFAYNEALQGINLIEDVRKKIEKKTQFFLTYLMLCIAGLATILLTYNRNVVEKRVIFGWIVSNSAIVSFVAIRLFVVGKKWFHYYATPRFLLENLHNEADEQEMDLRLIKQRNLKTLEMSFKSHNDEVLQQGFMLRTSIIVSIAINLLFAGWLVIIT